MTETIKAFDVLDYPTFEDYLYAIMEYVEADTKGKIEIKQKEYVQEGRVE